MSTDYDPEAIARACLAEQLDYLIDMDTESIVDSAGHCNLSVPHEDDEEGWDQVASAIGVLADQVLERFDLPREEV